MIRVRITRPAEIDLLEGYVFHETRRAGLGDHFLDSLYASIDSLTLYAGIHPKPVGDVHQMLAKRFPYAIYYELQGEIAVVFAVLDCRRNPAITAERLRNRGRGNPHPL